MGFEILFRERAKKEIEKSFLYYENEQKGLGKKFINELEFYLDILEEQPKRFRFIKSNFRVVVFQKFPFVLFFIIDKNKVVILNVFHTSRKPLKKYK